MRIVVYRNNPAGQRCNILAENLLNAVAEIVDEFNNLEIGLVYVEEGDEIVAPALKIDEELLGENISMDELMERFSTENLVELLKERAK
jgi:hypothetical protein